MFNVTGPRSSGKEASGVARATHAAVVLSLLPRATKRHQAPPLTAAVPAVSDAPMPRPAPTLYSSSPNMSSVARNPSMKESICSTWGAQHGA